MLGRPLLYSLTRRYEMMSVGLGSAAVTDENGLMTSMWKCVDLTSELVGLKAEMVEQRKPEHTKSRSDLLRISRIGLRYLG